MAAVFKSNPNCDWFMNAKYGIFVHYLYHMVDDPTNLERGVSLGDKRDWNDCVNNFDVVKFADDMQAAGAGYVIFTLLQSDAHTCVPNSIFEEILGERAKDFCAKRDLIMELSDELKKRNIPLILYFTGDGPWKNNDIFTKLTGKPFSPQNNKPTDWTDGFRKVWFKMAEEWSVRYGDRISGWWIDGADGCKDYDDEKLLDFKEHLLKGNKNAIVTFNPGGEYLAPWKYSVADDYTAGESAAFDDYPESRFVDGAQWHLISYTYRLINNCQKEGKDPAAELTEYLKKVISKQGVVSIDLSIKQNGSILEKELEILKRVKSAIRN